MADSFYTTLNASLLNSFTFRYPLNWTITNIKIQQLKIFSKVLSKKSVNIWGNYKIIITFNIKFNDNESKHFVKWKKITFNKILYYKNFLGNTSPKSIKSTISFLKLPNYFYSSKTYLSYLCSFKIIKNCKITLYSPLIITLYKINKNENNRIKASSIHKDNSTAFNDNNSTKAQNIITSKETLDTTILTKTSTSTTSSATNEYTTEEKVVIIDNAINKEATEKSTKDDHALSIHNQNINVDSNIVPEKIIDKTTKDSINNDINNKTSSYVSLKDINTDNISNENLNKSVSANNNNNNNILLKKKKLIECNTIIGKGQRNFFVERTIKIPSSTPPIWLIESIDTKVEILKLDLFSQKAIASGLLYLDINYKTFSSFTESTSLGSLNYIQVILPISTDITLTSDYDTKISTTDNCQLISCNCLSQLSNLKNPILLSSGETVYTDILEQLVIEIKVIATRTESFYINF